MSLCIDAFFGLTYNSLQAACKFIFLNQNIYKCYNYIIELVALIKRIPRSFALGSPKNSLSP